MTELQQRRWFTRKSISFPNDYEVLVTSRNVFGEKANLLSLFDLHPFYERYQNNALGYFWAACLLLVLGIGAAWIGVHLTPKSIGSYLQSWLFFACSAVVFALFAQQRIAKYEFFLRGSGKSAFSLLGKHGPNCELAQYAQDLSEKIKLAIDNRFQNARQVFSPKLRHGASEEAIYLLYRFGVLDFAEVETLLVNAKRKFSGTKSDQESQFKQRTNNVINFQEYVQKRAGESNG